MKADAFDGKYLWEFKTVSNGPRRPELRDGEIRSIVNVTLLDGSKWVKEVIAFRGKPLYTYHNNKRVFIEHVEGKEFREVVYDRTPDIAEAPKKTWKFVGGKAVKS